MQLSREDFSPRLFTAGEMIKHGLHSIEEASVALFNRKRSRFCQIRVSGF